VRIWLLTVFRTRLLLNYCCFANWPIRYTKPVYFLCLLFLYVSLSIILCTHVSSSNTIRRRIVCHSVLLPLFATTCCYHACVCRGNNDFGFSLLYQQPFMSSSYTFQFRINLNSLCRLQCVFLFSSSTFYCWINLCSSQTSPCPHCCINHSCLHLLLSIFQYLFFISMLTSRGAYAIDYLISVLPCRCQRAAVHVIRKSVLFASIL